MADDAAVRVSRRVEQIATKAIRMAPQHGMTPEELLSRQIELAPNRVTKADLTAALDLIQLLESVPSTGLDADGGGRGL